MRPQAAPRTGGAAVGRRGGRLAILAGTPRRTGHRTTRRRRGRGARVLQTLAGRPRSAWADDPSPSPPAGDRRRHGWRRHRRSIQGLSAKALLDPITYSLACRYYKEVATKTTEITKAPFDVGVRCTPRAAVQKREHKP